MLSVRKFLRLIWTTLLLLLVALVSALTAMHFAIHGREVIVSDFKGQTPGDARRVAEENGLTADVASHYYSPTIPEGRIVSQTPPAGTVVRRGWEIRLAVSLGPQRVVVPDVVGQTERAASINLQQRGLDIASVASLQLSGVDAGEVIAQSPPARATGISGPKIDLLVAQTTEPQPFVMPNFTGQPLGSVIVLLKTAGFALGRVRVVTEVESSPDSKTLPEVPRTNAPSASEASIVVSQDPAPGERITAGAAVNFTVR